MGTVKCQVSHAFLLLPTAVVLIYLGGLKGLLPASLLFGLVFVGQKKKSVQFLLSVGLFFP